MYFIILIYFLFLVYTFDFKKNKCKKSFFYWSSCFILVLVAGLRYRIGVDTISYMSSYDWFPTINNFKIGYDYRTDFLWALINSISKTISEDFYIVQLFQALILNVVVFWFIKKHSPYPFLGCLLFYVFQWWNLCFEAMRESIAVAIFLYAIDAVIVDNNYRKYYIRVWPAVLAHTFGFMTLFFPFIQLLKFKKNTYLMFAVLVILALFFSNYLNLITLLLQDTAKDKVEMFLYSKEYGGMASFGYILFSVIGIILPCLIAVKMIKSSYVESYKRFIPYLMILAIIVVLRLNIAIFFRLYNYFEIFFLIGITQAIAVVGDKQRWMIKLMIFFALTYKIVPLTMPVFYYRTDIKVYHRYYPYNSIFSKDYNEKTEWIFREKGHLD